MYNAQMRAYGDQPSAIRELFAYGVRRKAEIGDDKVFDFSIGNPSVPAPEAVGRAIVELGQADPVAVHAYTQAAGDPAVRASIAEHLNKLFGTDYGYEHLYLTAGAAAGLAITLKALIVPEDADEVVAISPFFPEYRTWTEVAGGTLVNVPAREADFQIDLDAMQAAVGPHTKAVIINSPNNPVGVVYSRENLAGLADLLRAKSAEYGHAIYLVSDEPYRELVYGGLEVSWVPSLYDNTIVCYSWSKCLSLPGERLGFILVPPAAEDAAGLYNAVAGAGRILGFICTASLFQRVIQQCLDAPVNTAAYERNRGLLTAMMDDLGYEYIQPQGAFYLWVKALEPDAQAFSDRAKAHELLLVPSDSFGTPGWVRLGYCVPESVIVNSRDAFAALKADYE